MSTCPRPSHSGHWPALVLKEKCPGFQRRRRGQRGVRERLPDRVERARVGGRRRPGVLADRRRVDLGQPADPGRGQPPDMPRRLLARPGWRAARAPGCRAPGRSCPRRTARPPRSSPARGNDARTSCRLYRSATSTVTASPSVGRRLAADGRLARQVRADDRVRCSRADVGRGALRDDGAAVPPAPGPSSITQSAALMTSISCSTITTELPLAASISMVGAQPLDVARVQADRRLVEHVEHAGGVGADGRGQLEALPFPGRQRAARPGRAAGSRGRAGAAGRAPAGTPSPGRSTPGRVPSAPGPARRSTKPRSSSRVSALISARLRPSRVLRSASGRSRVPWQTEQMPHLEELLHPAPAGRVVAAGRVLDRGDRVLVVHLQGDRARASLAQRYLALDRRPVEHDVPLLAPSARGTARRAARRAARRRTGRAAAAGVPRQHGAVVDALVLVRHQRRRRRPRTARRSRCRPGRRRRS